MTNEELFGGIRVVRDVLEAQANPIAQVLGLGLGIALAVAEKAPETDPVVALRAFRDGLRASVTADVQAALDASSSNG